MSAGECLHGSEPGGGAEGSLRTEAAPGQGAGSRPRTAAVR